MSFTDTDFDRAFAEWQEFGPQRRIPVEQRWPVLFPHASSDDFEDARRRCQEIESFAYDLADQVLAHKLNDKEAFRRFSSQYPTLTAERLNRTWSQAMYFASK
jgi:hypothetical protein